MAAAARPPAPPGNEVISAPSCPPAPVDVKARLSADKRFTAGAKGTPPLLALAPAPGHDVTAPACVCAACTAAMAESACELVRSVASIGYATPGLRETELAFSPDEAYRTLSQAPVCPSELFFAPPRCVLRVARVPAVGRGAVSRGVCRPERLHCRSRPLPAAARSEAPSLAVAELPVAPRLPLTPPCLQNCFPCPRPLRCSLSHQRAQRHSAGRRPGWTPPPPAQVAEAAAQDLSRRIGPAGRRPCSACRSNARRGRLCRAGGPAAGGLRRLARIS